jgi:hypothetical protein
MHERILMKLIRAKLTYANVISTLCLFLLVGGGAAWAAIHLPKNSVGAKQLKKGAVTPAKLSQSTKTTLKGATGPQGPAGPQGPKGDPATALWAEISETGKVVKGSGVVNAKQPFGEGTYEVNFNRDVTGCTYQATSSDYPGMIILVEPRDNDPNGVYVETTEEVGGTQANNQFDLAVFC